MILQGKRLLITGGAKRVGLALAMRMAKAGCRIVLHARSQEAAEAAAALLPGTGHAAVSGDLSQPFEVENLCRQAGKVELLINNAAIFHRPGSPEDAAAAKLYHQINFAAPAKLLEYFFSQDIVQGAAVNITDCFALLPGEGAYWQSKKDLNELTVALAPKWAQRGFRINAVAPGPMLPPPWAPESRMEKILKIVPLHRAVGVDEVTEAVELLLKSDSLTGTVIPVDGGIWACR